MSKKGGSGHVKRLAASRYLKINRKAVVDNIIVVGA
mgnify:CR=1 FL=1